LRRAKSQQTRQRKGTMNDINPTTSRRSAARGQEDFAGAPSATSAYGFWHAESLAVKRGFCLPRRRAASCCCWSRFILDLVKAARRGAAQLAGVAPSPGASAACCGPACCMFVNDPRWCFLFLFPGPGSPGAWISLWFSCYRRESAGWLALSEAQADAGVSGQDHENMIRNCVFLQDRRRPRSRAARCSRTTKLLVFHDNRRRGAPVHVLIIPKETTSRRCTSSSSATRRCWAGWLSRLAADAECVNWT